MTYESKSHLFELLSEFPHRQPFSTLPILRQMRAVSLIWNDFTGLHQSRTWYTFFMTVEDTMKQFTPSTFSSIRILADDQPKFAAWVKALKTDPLEIVQNLCGSGFKFSVTWVAEQNSFCASLIGTEATKAHRGMVMTSWSDDLAEAIYITAYKHFEMCNEGAWPKVDTTQRWG